jgi:putative membrane protein
MQKYFALLALLSLFVAGCGNGISDNDRMFMSLAGSAGIMEVKIGQMAADRSSRPDVIAYGKEMVIEHTEFNKEFHDLLKKLGETVPDTMNSDDKDLVNNLVKIDSSGFDNLYISDVYADHKMAVAAFDSALVIAKNPEYIKFLKKGQVIVKHHYLMAQKLLGDTTKAGLAMQP